MSCKIRVPVPYSPKRNSDTDEETEFERIPWFSRDPDEETEFEDYPKAIIPRYYRDTDKESEVIEYSNLPNTSFIPELYDSPAVVSGMQDGMELPSQSLPPQTDFFGSSSSSNYIPEHPTLNPAWLGAYDIFSNSLHNTPETEGTWPGHIPHTMSDERFKASLLDVRGECNDVMVGNDGYDLSSSFCSHEPISYGHKHECIDDFF